MKLKKLVFKKVFYLFLVAIMSSCSISIKSIVDSKAKKEIYTNPLIVIPYEKNTTEKFNSKLKKEIETLFTGDKINVETFICETTRGELKLNDTSENDEKINSIIKNEGKDLLIIFKPRSLNFMNGSIVNANYEVVAIDVSRNMEVWKSEFDYAAFFGSQTFVATLAKKIYSKLKTDKIF